MKVTEITRMVEELISSLPSNSNGTFGQIEILRTDRVRIKSKIHVSDKGLMWEPDDFKPLFQIEHKMDKGFIQDPLCFSIGRTEIWVSTWYGSIKEKEALKDPFVLSWKKFLETYEIKQTVGLDGNCNCKIFTLEEGFSFLRLWINWVVNYS